MVLKIDPEFKALVPPQRFDEHKSLEESILKNGFDKAYPIIVWDGTVIDGHNRYEICSKHNIQFSVSEKEFDNRHDVINWIIDNQLSRRNISDDQRAYLIGRRYKEEKKAMGGDRTSEEARAHIEHMRTAEKIAIQHNINHNTVKRAEKFADAVDNVAKNTGIDAQKILSGDIKATRKDIKVVSEIAPDQQKKVFEKIEHKVVKNVKEALAEIKKEIIEEKKDHVVLPPQIRLINDDFKNVLPTLEKESIDFIITDPPYPKEYLPLYEDLAKYAVSVLKPGGSLLVMVGQSYLPDVLKLITPYLQYHWTISYLTPGGQAVQLWQRKVNTFWKPVLWFTKGDFKGEWIGDVVRSNTNDNDKRFHDWGQSESGMLDLIKRFTEPDDIILDPFMGGGTTGMVCKHLKCQFIGIEKDINTFNTAKVRLGE